MKRFISSVLCIILILSCFSVCVSATGEGTIAASTAKAKPGDTVNIQVSVSNNPGVVMLGLDVGYDSSVMKLTKVTDGALLGTATHTKNLERNPYHLTWDNPTVTTDFTQNGVIVTLTFLINNDASPGSYPISLSYEKDNSEIMNVNMDDVDFVLENGAIVIENIHTHTSETIPGTAATCTEDGMTDGEKCSECGEILKKQEVIPAAGHKWDNGKITKAPTCTKKGVKQFTCTVCGEKKTESVASLGHNWNADFTIDKEPTTTAPGEKSIHCSRCDARKDITEIEKIHTHISVTIPGKAATCTEEGLTDGEKCSECDEILKKQETIPAAGHKWDNGKITKAPTCTEKGVKQFTCTVCGEKKTESVASLGHDWNADFTIDKEPTTTAPGEKSIHCSRCDARKDITEIPIEILSGDVYKDGDVDGDGQVLANDAWLALLFSAKLERLNEKQMMAADIDDNGQVFVDDAKQILQYSGMLASKLDVDKAGAVVAPDFDRLDIGEGDLIDFMITVDAEDGGMPSRVFVTVSAKQLQELNAFNLYLQVDPARLSMSGYESEAGIVVAGECEGHPGWISVSFITLDAVENEDLELCTLEFDVVEPGTTGIRYVATCWEGAAFPTGGNININVCLGKCGADVSWYVEDNEMIISGTGEMDDYGLMYDVESPPAPWIERNNLVSDVTGTRVQDGITAIGNDARLPGEKVYLPLSLERISANAFAGAKDIYYAGTKEQWDNIRIAYDNKALKEATVHCSDESFKPELAKPSAGEGLTWDLDENGVLTVSGSGSLDGSSMGEIYNISAWQYEETEVKTVILEEGVKGIGSNVFRWDDNMISVTAPASLTEIGSGAFPDSLKDVYYHGSKEQWDRIDKADDNYALSKATIHYIGETGTGIEQTGSCGENVTYMLDGDGKLTISGSGPMTDYEFESPFSGNASIKTVIIENGVTSAGDYSFAGCTGITGVTIPDSVTSVGAMAFSSCSGITEIKLPDGLEHLGGEVNNHVFSGCTGLKKVTLPGGIKYVGDRLFSGCENLESVVIMNGVTSIEEDAFLGCEKLKTVIIPPSVTAIAAGVVPEDATVIGAVGSYAEKWAEKNKVKFESYTFGDVDGNGEVLASDARLALRASASLEDLEDWQIKLADVDGSGKVLANDARQILRFSAQLQTSFDKAA